MAHGDVGGKLSSDDVARLSEQLGRLTAAGLPLGPVSATARSWAADHSDAFFMPWPTLSIAARHCKKPSPNRGPHVPVHLRGLVLIGARTAKPPRFSADSSSLPTSALN